jgi:uncharacterized protein (TIGR00255 family)
MLKSMTAYGRASLNTDVGHFVLEIQSVNRKFLEINVLLPKELSRFDIDLKKWVAPFVSRGQVTIKISASFEGVDDVPFSVKPNIALAKQMKKAWDDIADKLGVKESFNLSLLADVEGILLIEENDAEDDRYRLSLKTVLDKAVKDYVEMKRQEGSLLQADIMSRLQKIYVWMEDIQTRTPFATKKYKEKLVARLEELHPGHIENEDRILREIALFAEKIDITEEITRFFCHLTRTKEIIQSDQETIGKTLEFILQELGREINTIASKSSDLEIANNTINIKSELEKIREQIQNVE